MKRKSRCPQSIAGNTVCSSELLNYAGDLSEKQQMETWLRHHRGNIDRYPDTAAIRKCVSK